MEHPDLSNIGREIDRPSSPASSSSQHTHSINETDAISICSTHSVQSCQEIQLPASARLATGLQILALSANLSPGAVEAGTAVNANNTSNHNISIIAPYRKWLGRQCDRKFATNSALIWLSLILTNFVMVMQYDPEETHDCPQMEVHQNYARYTCGPIVWCSSAALAMCVAKLASTLWRFSPAHAFPQWKKSRKVCDILEPLLTVAIGVLVFVGCAWFKLCLHGCAADY